MSDTPYASPPPPPPGAPKDNVQLYGILGIVLAVVCCPLLGILFGYLSMRDARRLGKDQTLGKVGFWLGIALTAVGVIAGIIAVCAGGFGSMGWNDDYNY